MRTWPDIQVITLPHFTPRKLLNATWWPNKKVKMDQHQIQDYILSRCYMKSCSQHPPSEAVLVPSKGSDSP